jgi:hypothetical protein
MDKFRPDRCDPICLLGVAVIRYGPTGLKAPKARLTGAEDTCS